MGFARRGSGLPDDHGLLVRAGDLRAVEPDQVGRFALTTPDVTAVAPVTPTFTKFSTFDLFSPAVTGLRSVFPTFLTNDIEF
jgi:hypothetical protein